MSAQACNVSISSVSLVLNEKPLANLLSEKTRAAVRAAARNLGYTPNRNAQALRSQRSHTIGVVVFDIADPFCTLIIKGIQTALEPTGMLPIIMDATNQGKQFERYLVLMMERRVEGLIVVANWLLSNKDITGNLEAFDVPVVIVGREVESATVSSVLVTTKPADILHSSTFTRWAIAKSLSFAAPEVCRTVADAFRALSATLNPSTTNSTGI